jgi:hypothetical protein
VPEFAGHHPRGGRTGHANRVDDDRIGHFSSPTLDRGAECADAVRVQAPLWGERNVDETLFFVDSDPLAAQGLAGEYQSRGFGVAFSAPDLGAVDQVVAAQPVATIFALGGERAEEVCSIAESIACEPRAGRPLLVFVGGVPEIVGRAKAFAPLGVFVHPDELGWVLKRLTAKS